MRKTFIAALFMMCAALPAFASGAENLWTTGKIHVVLGVLLIILLGIIIFLVALERKISKLEKNI